MTNVHIDDARRHAIEALTNIVQVEDDIQKAVLGQDIYGLLRVILWLSPDVDEAALRARVMAALAPCGHFWTGEVWISSSKTSRADDLVYSMAWDEGVEVPDVDKLRIDDRPRTRTAWLPRFRAPVWEAHYDWRGVKTDQESSETPLHGPPVVIFYSFKGGMGRTTALAAFALQRAQDGQRVLVLDFDLDAPGAGTLLSPDPKNPPEPQADIPRGIVDYLLEAPLAEVQLGDYVHRCKRESLVGDAGGEIVVMPAGNVDESYLLKLSRLDLEIRGEHHPFEQLLLHAREEFEPDWILIDSRAGLSPAAGLLLDGVAHLHVLFGSNSRQNQLGVEQVIRTLGEERIRRNFPQADCLVVQAMVVNVVEVERAARAQFQSWLEPAMRDHYVVPAESDPNDEFWSVLDMGGRESPDQCIPIPYTTRLAFFPSIDDVARDLVVSPYDELGRRILVRFRFGENVARDEGD